MNKLSTGNTSINRPVSSQYEEKSLNASKASNPSAFSALYDQYASILLGIITKIIRDENEATVLLEETFIKIHAQIDRFQPNNQPLFAWLLEIARCTALDALKKRNAIKLSALQLTPSGTALVTSLQAENTAVLTNPTAQSATFQLKELLDAVLFKNCTPEEAAVSFGISAELARQQLRLAMQQLRATQ